MRVLRYQIPVGGDWSEFTLSGPIVKVASRNGVQGTVHFWALADAGTEFTARLRVFGTGSNVPDNTVYRGTAIAEPYVWHLFEAVS